MSSRPGPRRVWVWPEGPRETYGGVAGRCGRRSGDAPLRGDTRAAGSTTGVRQGDRGDVGEGRGGGARPEARAAGRVPTPRCAPSRPARPRWVWTVSASPSLRFPRSCGGDRPLPSGAALPAPGHACLCLQGPSVWSIRSRGRGPCGTRAPRAPSPWAPGRQVRGASCWSECVCSSLCRLLPRFPWLTCLSV